MSITRLDYGRIYYYIDAFGLVEHRKEIYGVFDDVLYRRKNYFLEFETALEFAQIFKKTLNDFWNEKEK